MKAKEGKKPNTAYAYANSIDKISQHYSEQTGNKLNIYRENDINIIKKISYDYSKKLPNMTLLIMSQKMLTLLVKKITG